ncbi:hypothetical protein A8990_12811 [Paenibacillus taihuensis]|uniref:Uncharacterized protein n=1 Tax=Paenibacillus taihuensis TaxID=1156355 RepID=A0A3D9R489_9BACL|nr:hypothetical protein A8990_12811 [Paenibacillus taihuensis]
MPRGVGFGLVWCEAQMGLGLVFGVWCLVLRCAAPSGVVFEVRSTKVVGFGAEHQGVGFGVGFVCAARSVLSLCENTRAQRAEGGKVPGAQHRALAARAAERPPQAMR